jgi:putative ABC transport system permease protein
MFFKLVYRIWKKNAASFILRLLGLTLSLSFIIILLVFILHEYSYDNHIKNRENIYRVTTFCRTFSYTEAHSSFIPRSIILNNIPEIVDLARYRNLPDIFIKNGENYIPEKRIRCADFQLFKILDLQLLDGDFSESDFVYNIALSRKTAEKYFPDRNAVGEFLTMKQGDKEINAFVNAVFEDIPDNSTFNADIIGNFQIQFFFQGEDFSKEPWDIISQKPYFTTYITLRKDCDPIVIEDKMNSVLFPPDQSPEFSVHLQHLPDIYLGSKDLINNSLPAGSRSNIQLFIIICIVLVFIATSNLGLITATFHFHRKHEYFVRITHGATRYNILVQILGETLLIITISLVLSIMLSALLKPSIYTIFGKRPGLDQASLFRFVALFAVILAFIGLVTVSLTGAFIFGKNSGISHQRDNSSLFLYFKWNRLLVLGQIAAFSSLIVISALLLNQWKFLKSKDALGFNPDKLLVLELPRELNENCDVLINELTSNPQILGISKTNYIPMLGPISNGVMLLCLTDDYTKQTSLLNIDVGSNYFKTLGLNLVGGREFDLSGKYDRDNSIMLNESAVKSLGLENPIGKKVAFKEIIGIVKDFPIESLYEKIAPLYIFPAEDYTTYILVKYQGDRSAVYNYIANKQSELVPVSELNLNDFPNIINDTYENDKRLKSIFVLFTIIALIVGIFGIIGLLIFTLQKRSKEITIRIIHGASYYNIVSMISKEFLMTVIISNIITYPLIWYFANDWLNNFTSHIKISPFYFLAGTVVTVFIVLAIVSIIILKHIRENPIKNFNR